MSSLQAPSTVPASPNSIRVSPRHLGQMRRADFSPHCFWHSIALGFRHPFDMPMPGIMFNMDGFQKKLIQAHFDTKGVAPKWLASLGCTEPVSFPAKMTMEFPKYGLTLVGMPDGLFRKKDGTLYLVDYKTARYKGADDPFMPGYETQLWGYAQLLEHHHIGTVTSAAIVYFENTLTDFATKPLDLLTNDGMQVPFKVRIHEVAIDRGAIEPLMKAYRMYADMAKPPEENDGCKTCERLKVLFDAENGARGNAKAIKGLENKDTATLNYIIQVAAANRREARARQSFGWEDSLADSVDEDIDCIPADWDL